MTQMTRHSPVRTLSDLQREVDDIFGRFFSESGSGSSSSATWAPRTDLVESDEQYTLHLDVPGMTKDDISINVQNNTLTVSGERAIEKTKDGEERVRVERSYGTFHRTFALPNSVDASSIEAKYDNGVLKISVPKTENAARRRIEIQ